MIGGDVIGFHYVLSTVIAFALAVALGFSLHSTFTFEQRPSVKSFLRYTAGMAMNFPAWIALLFLFCDVLGLSVPVASAVATILLFVWNFAASRWAIVGSVFSVGRTAAGRSSAKP
jgi:putative flippase GtrA